MHQTRRFSLIGGGKQRTLFDALYNVIRTVHPVIHTRPNITIRLYITRTRHIRTLIEVGCGGQSAKLHIRIKQHLLKQDPYPTLTTDHRHIHAIDSSSDFGFAAKYIILIKRRRRIYIQII